MISNFIKTANSVTVIFTDKDPVNVLFSDKKYVPLVEALSKQKLEAAEALLIKKLAVGKVGRFEVDAYGTVVIDNEVLPKVLSDRLLKFASLNIPTTPLEKFWDNLKQNPSEESKKDLYTFLEKNHIPLTENGCFTAYKKVRDDFKDVHTGTISNHVGAVVKMDRAAVNADRNVTCSSGLHVAAFTYAKDFSGTRLVEVEVNPRDVVSVPTDYDAQKMRVCQYTVVREHTDGEIQEELRGVETPKFEPAVETTIPRITTKKNEKFFVDKNKDGRIPLSAETLAKIGSPSFVKVAEVNGKLHVGKSVYGESWTGFTNNPPIRIPKSLSDEIDKDRVWVKVVGDKLVIW